MVFWLFYSNVNARPPFECTFTYDSVLKTNIYTYVEEEPEFPGGDQAMIKFILKNFKYPSKQESVQASFFTEFIIDSNGHVLNARIYRKGLTELTPAEKEILRVIGSFPDWKPGKCNGSKVAFKYFLPIRF